jgi:hypothetical protein
MGSVPPLHILIVVVRIAEALRNRWRIRAPCSRNTARLQREDVVDVVSKCQHHNAAYSLVDGAFQTCGALLAPLFFMHVARH